MGYKVNSNRNEVEKDLIKKLMECGIEIKYPEPKKDEKETKEKQFLFLNFRSKIHIYRVIYQQRVFNN